MLMVEGTLIGMGLVAIVVAGLISNHHTRRQVSREAAVKEAKQADKELAAAEQRVRCAREGHVGYLRAVHGRYCPVCKDIVR